MLDTNVFVAAMRFEGGASRQVMRQALNGVGRPLFGHASWLEHEARLGRGVRTAGPGPQERRQMLAALAAAGRWVWPCFGWRPNLRGEGDNRLIELAIAGQAIAIVTHNLRELRHGESSWKHPRVLTPAPCLETCR